MPPSATKADTLPVLSNTVYEAASTLVIQIFVKWMSTALAILWLLPPLCYLLQHDAHGSHNFNQSHKDFQIPPESTRLYIPYTCFIHGLLSGTTYCPHLPSLLAPPSSVSLVCLLTTSPSFKIPLLLPLLVVSPTLRQTSTPSFVSHCLLFIQYSNYQMYLLVYISDINPLYPPSTIWWAL